MLNDYYNIRIGRELMETLQGSSGHLDQSQRGYLCNPANQIQNFFVIRRQLALKKLGPTFFTRLSNQLLIHNVFRREGSNQLLGTSLNVTLSSHRRGGICGAHLERFFPNYCTYVANSLYNQNQ